MVGFPKGKDKRGEKARDPSPGAHPVNREDMIKALKKHDGNISRAAEAIGCTRLTIHRAVESDPLVKEARDQAREAWVDQLENACEYQAIHEKDTALKIFLLKTRARARGYEQDMNPNATQDIAKAAFDFVLNRTANPAES